MSLVLHSVGYFSDFGDENILWPLNILIFALLCLQKRWMILGRWLVLLALTFGLMLLLKLWFEACGRTGGEYLYSPSGHTAGATFVYGSMILLFGRHIKIGFVFGILLAVTMGASRVILHAHSVIEVIVGGGVGFIFGLLPLSVWRHQEKKAQTLMMQHSFFVQILLILIFASIALVLYGHRSPLEKRLEVFSHYAISPLLRCSTRAVPAVMSH